MGRLTKGLIGAAAIASITIGMLACSGAFATGVGNKIALEETEPPSLPSDASISITSAQNQSIAIAWLAATDNASAQSELEYYVAYASTEAAVSGTSMLSSATAAKTWTAGITSATISSLDYATVYYINVATRDRGGNIAYYTPASGTTKNDLEAPVPGGGFAASGVGMEQASLSWTAASDPGSLTAQAKLQYKLVYSTSPAIDTVADAEANGSVAMDWTAAATGFTVTGLLDDKTYYFNVLVRDGVSNKAKYGAIAATTPKHSRIFYSQQWASNQRISKANPDGTLPSDIVTSGFYSTANPFAIAIDPVDRKVYWICLNADASGTDIIQRSNFDGSGVESVITTGLSAPYGIAVDYAASRRYLYWTDSSTQNIYRSTLPPATLNAANHILLTNSSNGVTQPYGIEVDQSTGDFYWTQKTSPYIRKASAAVPTSISNVMTSGLNWPIDLAYDYSSKVLYWTDIGALKVQKQTASGGYDTSSDVISSGLAAPSGITVDSATGNIFWVDANNNNLYRCPSTTASSAAGGFIIISSLNIPRGIQLY